MSTPRVSIVMPAFNAERLIAETIQSVQTQTFENWELLVVDDGCTDGTSQVVETFSADPRIRLLRQKNGGVASARNTALKSARGEWIAFLDADDVWCKDKLSEQIKAVEQQPKTNLVFTNYYLWDGERDLELRFKSGKKFPCCDFERRLIFFNLFGMSSVLVRRDALERVGEFDQQVAPAEDWDLWLRLADDGLQAVGIDKPLLRYRLWSGNASKNSIRMMQANVRVLQKGLHRCANTGNGRERDYARALEMACGNLELAKASANIANAPKQVAQDIGRAWRHCPTRLKWLGWYVGALWPGILGGELFRRRIYKKIQSKW